MKPIVRTAPTVLFAGVFAAGLIGAAGLVRTGGMAIAPPTRSFTPSEPESSAKSSSFTPSASTYIAPIVGQPLRTEGGGTR